MGSGRRGGRTSCEHSNLRGRPEHSTSTAETQDHPLPASKSRPSQPPSFWVVSLAQRHPRGLRCTFTCERCTYTTCDAESAFQRALSPPRTHKPQRPQLLHPPTNHQLAPLRPPPQEGRLYTGFGPGHLRNRNGERQRRQPDRRGGARAGQELCDAERAVQPSRADGHPHGAHQARV